MSTLEQKLGHLGPGGCYAQEDTLDANLRHKIDIVTADIGTKFANSVEVLRTE